MDKQSFRVTNFMKNLHAVSICIPTYNGAKWILNAVESAINQTYSDFEIVIVDDASTDQTVDLVRKLKHPKINTFVNSKRLGIAGNWNQSIAYAKGDYIKFLFQDDLLAPTCLEKMVELFKTHNALGMVFSKRRILIDDPFNHQFKKWEINYGSLHKRFKTLKTINVGVDLLREYVEIGPHKNLIGEPPAVMIRKECFSRVGKFNPYMEQLLDCEMWLRVMVGYDIGFIDEELCTFRVHKKAQTWQEKSTIDAIERLWCYEGVLLICKDKQLRIQLEKLRKIEIIKRLKKLCKAFCFFKGCLGELQQWIKYIFRRQSFRLKRNLGLSAGY